MSLRARIVVYLAAIHLLFGSLAVFLLRQYPYWLFVVEGAFVVSVSIGIWFARRTLYGLSLGADAAHLIREEELTSRLRETGDPALDALIGVYNRMVDSLRAERTRVQEQQHFFSQVIGASPTGIVILDLDGRIIDVNPAGERLVGLTRAVLVGRALTDVDSVLMTRLGSLPPRGSDVVGLAGPRRVRCQHGTFMDRGFTRHFYVIEELTEELRRFERDAYEKLIRVMSHEVNNTVTSANSLLHSSLVYTRALAPESRADVERAIGIVIARTEALSTFMRGFADVFRLPAPVLASRDLKDVVEPLVQLVRARPESMDVRITWEVPAHPLAVRLDSSQFDQACLNILKNAIEAAGPGGWVSVRAETMDGRPRLVVKDSGPGFSAEVHENLFTPFFSTKTAGQGIGLTLVQEILSAHGFDYSLEHRGEGPTTFTVKM